MVEVDETYAGGAEFNVVGRKTIKKSIVAIAVEMRGRGSGRVRVSRVNDLSAASSVSFVQAAVTPRCWHAVLPSAGAKGERRSSGLQPFGRRQEPASPRKSGRGLVRPKRACDPIRLQVFSLAGMQMVPPVPHRFVQR